MHAMRVLFLFVCLSAQAAPLDTIVEPGAQLRPVARDVAAYADKVRWISGWPLDRPIVRDPPSISVYDAIANEYVVIRDGAVVKRRPSGTTGRGSSVEDGLGNRLYASHGSDRFARGLSDVMYTKQLRVDGRPVDDLVGLAIRPFDSRTFAIASRHTAWEPVGDDDSGAIYELDFGVLPRHTGASSKEDNPDIRVLTRSIARPVGLALSRDWRVLYVANALGDELWQFDISPEGTRLMRPIWFYQAQRIHPTGLRDVLVDAADHVLCATDKGVLVTHGGSSSGAVVGLIETPEPAHALAFGDEDGRTLYVTAGRSVYSIRMKFGAQIPNMR